MEKYKVLENENIYLLALKLYGSVDYSYKIIADNNIEDINQDLSGAEIYYDEKIKPAVLQTLNLKEDNFEFQKKSYTAKDGMSIFDVCLNTIGDLEKIITLVINSEMKNLSSDVSGVNFKYISIENDLRFWAKDKEFATSINKGLSRFGSFDNGFDQQAFL